jgi:hypothetical protein
MVMLSLARVRSLTVLVLAVVLATGCRSASTDDDPSAGQEEGATGSAAAESSRPLGVLELAGHQQTHPSGTTVAVTAVEVDEAGDLYVSFEALVSGVQRSSARLASDRPLAEDDLGNRYGFVAPEANQNVSLPQDTRAEFTLAFEGPVDPDATRVTVGLNAGREFRTIEDTYANTIAPTFTFADLPLPGVGLDDEAAGTGDTVGLDLEPRVVEVSGIEHVGPAEVHIEVTRVEVTPTLVVVDIEAVNRSDRPRNVTQTAPRLAPELDGQSLGERYPFDMERISTEDSDHDRLTLEPGEELSASLAFRGVVPAHATSLRLGFQVLAVELNRGGDMGETSSSSPRVVMTGIPLPEGFGDDPTRVDDGDQAVDDGEEG